MYGSPVVESLKRAPAEGGAAQPASCLEQSEPAPDIETIRYAILTTGAPLKDWQRAVVANLGSTPGAQADGWLLPSESAVVPRERGFDFILSFAPAAAGRALIGAARWGVWQFFFGDWAAYRG